MRDLISRQDAIDAIKTWGLIDGLSEGQTIEILADEEKLPSVQPEKHGKWIRNDHLHRRCSECGAIMLDSEHENYCSNCGADMRSESLWLYEMGKSIADGFEKGLKNERID